MSGDGDEYYYSDEDYEFPDGDDDAAPESPAKGAAAVRGAASAAGGAAVGASSGAAAAVGGSGTGGGTSAHAKPTRGALSKASSVSTSTSGADYRLLAPDEIAAEQEKIVSEVAAVLDIPPECANTLLIHFKWSRDRLFDAYMADPKGVQKRVGIAHLGVSSYPPGSFTCDICMADNAKEAGFGLGCKHYFCRTCWAGYLDAAVAENGQSCIFTKCPATDCGEAVTSSVVTAMASAATADKWRRFELQQFVNINKSMAWCPNSGCSNAFIAAGPVKTAVCLCGMRFCFKCSKEAHDPSPCDQVEVWLDKCGNESETANWILANTKKCPVCTVRIEKNQGCNHMVCRNKGCRFEFCWVCLGAWAEHGQSTGGYYKCNKYKESKEVGGDKAKAELDRYLFYYQRYSNHDQAGRFAAKHRESTQRRMAELQSAGGLSYTDVTFLNDATEALLECRRVLKYTYVFGYYMKESAEKRLFEYLQEQLERSTEHLAELTEKPVDKMDRAEVINFTRVTMQFLRNLLSGIDDGLTA